MLSLEVSILILVGCSFLGLIWAILNAIQLAKIRVAPSKGDGYNSFSDVGKNHKKIKIFI